MKYTDFVEVYDKLYATPGKLEKTAILASFLKTLAKYGEAKWIYLLKGKVLPDYDTHEYGISRQLTIKILSVAFTIPEHEIHEHFRKIGDLGEIAASLVKVKKQARLFSEQLSVKKVFSNLQKLVEIEGKGSVGKKIDLVSELLGDASAGEAKYIIRTLLQDLRIGVADALLRDALAEAFFEKKEDVNLIGNAYDLSNDLAVVFTAAQKGKNSLQQIDIIPGKPINTMLAVKVDSLKEAFRICGKPAALEYKYDGFRMLLHKKGPEHFLFTRKLENVTKQFPDVVNAIKKHVRGESFILDSEVVGYNKKQKIYKQFEAISQRIKRKYDIDKLINELPVEVNVFDILYYNGKSYINTPFTERRRLLEKIIHSEEWVLQLAKQTVTEDIKKAEQFYKDALKKGKEGIIIKKLDASYKQGRHVGYMAKLKPNVRDLDVVVVGAEYGSGKRGGWLTSYVIACRDGEKFLEVGKVSSGLKEKKEQGTSYEEITRLLKKLIKEEKGNEVRVTPKIVISVTYQNIQKSPSYSSGYALRFPRITRYRPDRSVRDITSLEDIKKEIKKIKKSSN